MLSEVVSSNVTMKVRNSGFPSSNERDLHNRPPYIYENIPWCFATLRPGRWAY